MNLLSLLRPAHLAILSVLMLPVFTHAEPTGAAAEIASLEPAYQAAMEGVKAEREKWEKGLETWYLGSLDKVFADRTQAGDLDGSVAAKAERERVTAHGETSAEEIQKMPAALRTVRTAYDASRKKIGEEVAKRTGAANQKHLADLDALQKRLTQKNQIDEAIAVKAEKERFTAALAGGATVAAAAPAKVETPAAPAVAAEPKPVSTGPTASEAMTALLGRWRLTNPSNGWSGTRTFNKDGTFETESNTKGKWELDGDKVVMHYDSGGNADQMLLPLDPKDTKVKISRGRIIGAVKEAGE
ncbi:MAG TPA: hypothetical protein VGO11_09860 [Chthoniobacteraceae bacterium]|jgi:hypothetical protein|nr:hypothetical protein [Chthoniobacteraceae bacterium]